MKLIKQNSLARSLPPASLVVEMEPSLLLTEQLKCLVLLVFFSPVKLSVLETSSWGNCPWHVIAKNKGGWERERWSFKPLWGKKVFDLTKLYFLLLFVSNIYKMLLGKINFQVYKIVIYHLIHDFYSLRFYCWKGETYEMVWKHLWLWRWIKHFQCI